MIIKTAAENYTWILAVIWRKKTKFASYRQTPLKTPVWRRDLDATNKNPPLPTVYFVPPVNQAAVRQWGRWMGWEGGWVKTCLPEINLSKPANRKLNFSVRQNKNIYTQIRIQTVSRFWIFDLVGQLIMDGKFEFIAKCAVQFNSIVSGWVGKRCRMCDRNPAEFSSGRDFSSETKRFFLPSWVCVPRWPFSFIPPLSHHGS